MAIASFIVQTLLADEDVRVRIEAQAAGLAGISLHGWPKADTLVAVADAPADGLGDLMRQLSGIPGVVAVHVASLNMEDEILGAGPAAGSQDEPERGEG